MRYAYGINRADEGVAGRQRVLRLLMWRVQKRIQRVLYGKRHLFFEFSLCLSRACLGKMIVFIYKWLKMAFLT